MVEIYISTIHEGEDYGKVLTGNNVSEAKELEVSVSDYRTLETLIKAIKAITSRYNQ